MFRLLPGCLMVLMTIFLVFPIANAATLTLQSGQEIKGHIIEQTPLRITIDVQGSPKTFFLGEIATIDGDEIEVSQAKANRVELEKQVLAYKNEQNALIGLMNKRNSNVSASELPASYSMHMMALRMRDIISKMKDWNKAVVFTSDGGLVVVDSNQMIKYDKDFQVVKVINLTSIALPAASRPAVILPAPLQPCAVVPQNATKLKALPSSIKSAAAPIAQKKTTKPHGFFHNLISAL